MRKIRWIITILNTLQSFADPNSGWQKRGLTQDRLKNRPKKSNPRENPENIKNADNYRYRSKEIPLQLLF